MADNFYRTQPFVGLLIIGSTLALSWSTTTAQESGTSSPRQQCPSQCQCDAALLHIDCGVGEAGSLTRVPTGLPTTVQYLNLSGNNITHISGGDLANLTQLRRLDLSHNAVNNISGEAFTYTEALLNLNLQDNLLHKVPPQLFSVPSLQNLDISGNLLSDIELPEASADANVSVCNLTRLDLSFNSLTQMPDMLLASLPNLEFLDLQANELRDVSSSFRLENNNSSQVTHPLHTLSLARNNISHIAPNAFDSLHSLQDLDLSYNNLATAHGDWFRSLGQLKHLSLSHNPLAHLPNHLFAGCVSLETLDLSSMPSLHYISVHTLTGADHLQHLNLAYNPSLLFIHPEAFHNLSSLLHLDISHSGLTALHPATFHNLTSLQTLDLHGNPWTCDCEVQGLQEWLLEVLEHGLMKHDLVCSRPAHVRGMALQHVPMVNLTCEEASILNHTNTTWVTIGSSLVLDCTVDGSPRPDVIWRTSRGQVLHYKPFYVDYSRLDPGHLLFHMDHKWHETDKYLHEIAVTFDERIQVLRNGSLYIDYIMRADGGNFTCLAQNHLGNDTVRVEVRLDYTIMTVVKIESIICGFLFAITFFSITVLTSAIRFVVFFFSEEERKKRKSIREVLDTIHDYKSSKVEQLSAYKSAKLGQLSAYKTAKIDQLSAYKLAKVEKLTAFKTAKVGKIRTYKQATVTNVLHHMHHLREYYTNQMCRVKDNCTQQVERLRENYSSQMGKFKDYRSQHIDKIRENYQNQAVKIRDYGSAQMLRLREQYKTQQLHVLKLLELLDVGNCMTAIEAECMRTESMIFDPDITFDLEAKPVHVPRDLEESGDSEYLTAGTTSDISSVASAPYVLSFQNEKDLTEADLGEGYQNSLPDVTMATAGPSCSHSHQPKVRKKKKHKKRRPKASTDKNGGGRLAGDQSCDSLADATAGSLAPVHSRASYMAIPSLSLVLSAHAGAFRGREVSPGHESSGNSTDHYISAQASRDQTPEEAVLHPQGAGPRPVEAELHPQGAGPRPVEAELHPGNSGAAAPDSGGISADRSAAGISSDQVNTGEEAQQAGSADHPQTDHIVLNLIPTPDHDNNTAQAKETVV